MSKELKEARESKAVSDRCSSWGVKTVDPMGAHGQLHGLEFYTAYDREPCKHKRSMT